MAIMGTYKIKNLPLSVIYTDKAIEVHDGVYVPVKLQDNDYVSGIVIVKMFPDKTCKLFTEQTFASVEQAGDYAACLASTGA